jgi:hypothetical protein
MGFKSAFKGLNLPNKTSRFHIIVLFVIVLKAFHIRYWITVCGLHKGPNVTGLAPVTQWYRHRLVSQREFSPPPCYFTFFTNNTLTEDERYVFEAFVLLGCYAAYVDRCLPTLRHSLSVLNSRQKLPKYAAQHLTHAKAPTLAFHTFQRWIIKRPSRVSN